MNNDKPRINQELLNQVTADVVAKILVRVAKDLTDEDVNQIEQLDKDNPDGKKVLKYLYEKVPSLETIIFEELQELRKQATA